MKIKSLRLKGYKYFKFNHLNEVFITFQDLIQIILGKNGSGKSKLINQMSPLPALHNHFDKKGLKEIIIESRGIEYILISDFSQKKPHAFWKDGENLNPGGTISVQRELVQRELDYTEVLHNLLLDKTPFTKMSGSKRREFLQQISDCDVTFANDLYKKLMSGLRDALGTIKTLKGKVSKEVDSLKSVEVDVANIERLADRLQEELTILMEAKDPNQGESEIVLNRKLDVQLREFSEFSNQYIKAMNDVGAFAFEADLQIDKDELSNRFSKVNTTIHEHGVKIDALSSEYEKINKLMGDLYDSGTDNIKELEATIEKDSILYNEMKLKTEDHTFQFEGTMTVAHVNSATFKEKLCDVLTDLSDNSDRRFSRANIERVELGMRNGNAKRIKMEAEYERVVNRMSHIQNAENSECPKCDYKWIPGVSPRELDELRNKAGYLKEGFEACAKEVEVLTRDRDMILDWGVAYRNVMAVFDSFRMTDTLRDWLLEEDRIFHNPSQYTTIVNRWVIELAHYHEMTCVKHRIETCQQTLDQNKNIEVNTEGGGLREHLEEIEAVIYSLTEEVSVLNKDHVKLKRVITSLEQLEGMERTHERMMDNLDLTMADIVIATRNGEISKLIKEHQTNLSRANDKINLIRGYKHRIEALSDSITSTEVHLNVLKMLTGILSPMDGLIAKSMGNFIERFIEQINVVVNSIYTYPIDIMPCGIGDDGLNYKFPMRVNKMDEDPDDVSEGSDGQQEVINFAFKLVSTMFMGCDQFPLMLDETGRAQDETHMGNMMTYIKTLAADKSRQIFMISHFAAAHSSYNNANFIVLNGSNVTVPSNSNEFVELTYG